MERDSSSPRRKREARFVEIAAEAGVSLSTVNRVLNEHGSASQAARSKVIEAARRLGIKRILPDLQHGLVHIDVVITQSTEPFIKRIFNAVQRMVQMMDKRVVVHRMLVADDEKAIVQVLSRQKHRRMAIITMIPESPGVSVALQRLIDDGTCVITLVSDIHRAARSWYAGIDNYRAAATAAWFIKKFERKSGTVLKLMAHDFYVVHHHRSLGFDETMASASHLQVSQVTTWERPEACYAAVRHALKTTDLKAIYNGGSGSEGIHAALKEAGALDEVTWVGHELYDDHSQYLASGAMDLVIDQDTDSQVIAALQHALFACGVLTTEPRNAPVDFKLYCQQNLPGTPYLA